MQMRFQGVLEKVGASPSWVVVRVPFDPRKAWPDRPASAAGPRSTGDLRVKGTIRPVRKAGVEAASIAFSNQFLGKRNGVYSLLVTQKMQRDASVAPGSLVEVTVEVDLEKRPIGMPPELTLLFTTDRSALQWFGQLNYSIQRHVTEMIREPKSAETQQRRAEQWAERIMLAMEGELEIPPVLRVAFRAQPQAEAGWKAMTKNQRRIRLLSIFSAQSPEARAKRVQGAVTEALRAAVRAEKRGTKR
jgi:uncharacterized protein YdeI (YjbR/CyaY-like superfamily)